MSLCDCPECRIANQEAEARAMPSVVRAQERRIAALESQVRIMADLFEQFVAPIKAKREAESAREDLIAQRRRNFPLDPPSSAEIDDDNW